MLISHITICSLWKPLSLPSILSSFPLLFFLRTKITMIIIIITSTAIPTAIPAIAPAPIPSSSTMIGKQKYFIKSTISNLPLLSTYCKPTYLRGFFISPTSHNFFLRFTLFIDVTIWESTQVLYMLYFFLWGIFFNYFSNQKSHENLLVYSTFTSYPIIFQFYSHDNISDI